MMAARTFSTSKVLSGLLAIVTFITLWQPCEAQTFPGDPIPGLRVTLEQTPESSPPSIIVRVVNTNPEPVTVLSYNSPLDPLAFQLGLLTITPAGASAPLNTPQIQVRRVWPPKKESLITIAPGESATNDVVIMYSLAPPDQMGPNPSVAVRGDYMAVWASNADQINTASLQNPQGSPGTYQGHYSSNSLQLSIVQKS